MPEEPELHPLPETPQYPIPFIDVWFEEFDLPSQVLAGLKDAGHVRCTPIQAQVIPLGLAGRDVTVQVREDTGHTTAFLALMFSHLLRLPERERGFPSAILLTPDSERAGRIREEAGELGAHTGLTLALLPEGPPEAAENSSMPTASDILIGTPGSVIDVMKKGGMKPGAIKVLVIEDAARFFDLHQVRDLRYLLRKLPHPEKRLSLIFSSSLSFRVLSLIYPHMMQPEFVSETLEESQLQAVEQFLIHVASQEKSRLLPGLLKREEWHRVLIFANSAETVEKVALGLKANALPAEGVTEDMHQRKRFRLMDRVQKGHVRILVTTDGASRAVPLDQISHVVNFDLPQGMRTYVDRLRRISVTGRPGRIISLACEEFVFHLEPIEEMLGYKIPVLWPQDDWFVEETPPPSAGAEETPQLSPPARAEESPEERRSPRSRGGSKIVFSGQPGGVFGLAPLRTVSGSSPDHAGGTRKKPRRRRPRKGAKTEPCPSNQLPEPNEKISTE